MISAKYTDLNVAEFAAQAYDWELTCRILSRNETRVHGRKNIDVKVGHDKTGTIECTHSGPLQVSYRSIRITGRRLMTAITRLERA